MFVLFAKEDSCKKVHF
ncbi:unnamed protein product [Larinioides sclopetarius]|uniref:Uncharacterized protein n=1 Tax=Larinioides sclopetarius TaxID=280406 RepID=A0AAV1ZQN8_9ARAC